MFEVVCVIHVVVNNNLFIVCIQDSGKAPTPPDTQSDESTTSRDTDALIEALLAARKQAFSKAEENIAAAQKKQKEEYDRKHQPKVLKVGTVVLLENTMQKQRKGGKLEPLWLGPYTIHRDLGKGLYELSNQAGTVLKKKANIARLKEYVKRAQDVSHLLYTFQLLNVRYMYISNNAIVLFTMAYNHHFFFFAYRTPRNLPLPLTPSPRNLPLPLTPSPRNLPLPLTPNPRNLPLPLTTSHVPNAKG